MKRLVLLRHAKAESDQGAGDHARPLTSRGRTDAERIGQEIEARGFAPTLIICSTSQRTKETFDLVLPSLSTSPTVLYEKAVYLASSEDLLRLVARLPDHETTVLMIGHNPGFENLAARLAGTAKLASRIGEKFPTSACAVCESSASRWDKAAAGTWTLVDLVYPADL